MDIGLYTGFTGLALFFAAMVQAAADVETAGKAQECLDSCMRMVERFMDGVRSLKKEEWRRMVNPGEGSGIGGILKGLVFINRYSSGTYGSLLEKAKDLLLLLDFEDCEETDKAGGIAGLIVTLCRYEELYRDEKILKLIDRLAQKLASLKTLEYEGGFLWKTLDNKNHPISGAVHGMTGIAEAFLMADLRLGKKRYEKEIQDALEFENCCYREDLGGWPDRRALGSGRMAGGNCYGPIGMRIIYAHLGRAGIRHKLIQYNIKRAEASVSSAGGSGLDHLCCGEMSLADYYLETGNTEAAGRVLTEVVQTAKENGGYRLGFADCQSNDNVTLFYGLAGIGYELIRYTDKNRFPTIL